MVVPNCINNLEGFTGSILEQSFERLHNVTNKEARTVIKIANPADRIKYLLEMLEINRVAVTSSIAKSVLPKARTRCRCGEDFSTRNEECPV